jgi:acyl-CoA synthetase (NDP forming)
VVADPLGVAGAELVAPPAALAERIRALNVRVSDSPLIDLTLAGTRANVYGPVLEELLASEHCDAVLAAVGSSAQFHPQLAIEPILQARRKHTGKALAVFLAPEAPASLQLLAQAGVAAFRTPESCAEALAAFLSWRAPHAEAAPAAASSFDIPQAPSQRLRSPDEPITIPFPVAIKIDSPDIEHKTEVGGVELGLRDAKEAAAAAKRVLERVRAARPHARIEGVVASSMQTGLGEAILGYRVDPQVGPLVLVGAGGTLAELYRDFALRLAPVTLEQAREMVAEVRGFAPLRGYRNAPRGDLEALAQAVSAFSRLAARPEVAEAEINPLIVKSDGVVGVDALTILREGAPDHGPAA